MPISSEPESKGPEAAPRSAKGQACHAVVKLLDLPAIASTLGEQSARLLLEEFEHRLRTAVRDQDRLLKISAGKYCIVLAGVNQPQLADLALAKLERALSEPADVIDRQVNITYAIGMALPQTNVSNKRLLQFAEQAMQQAQARGLSCVMHDPETHASTGRPDAALLPRLETALQEGEFVLYYQPKIAAQYGTVVGAEGLVRWHDSQKKKVYAPGAFIELVERSKLLQPLTETLLRMAVAKCVNWSGTVSMALNVAPMILETPQFVQVVQDSVSFFGLEPKRLVLEITERGELPRLALEHLTELREFGVKIAIDDFGTGQCSLSYFRDLPADEIKIDQTFVQAMNSSKKDRAIVHSCIELAHDCGMRATAEGVEDQATVDALMALNCDVLQGYFFGKPMPEKDFEAHHLDGLSQSNEPDRFSSLLK